MPSADSTPTPPVEKVGPTDRLSQLALRFRLGQEGFFELSRALSWLREESSSVEVEVTLRATAKGGGYDQVRLRNGVTEPLTEGGAELFDDQPS